MLAMMQSQMGYLAPVSTPRTVSPRLAVDGMPGTGPETLNKVFDPLKFTEYGSDKTLAWCRAGLIRRLQCGYPWLGRAGCVIWAAGHPNLLPALPARRATPLC